MDPVGIELIIDVNKLKLIDEYKEVDDNYKLLSFIGLYNEFANTLTLILF